MHRPERYNAKARKSIAGSSHKRGKTRAKKPSTEGCATELVDANTDILEHKTAEAKDADKKERMRQELLEESQSKSSSKKKKRLDKYIEKKLKKEERLDLFDKLAKSQAQLSSSLQLHSSSTLGTGNVSTNQERLDKLEDKDVRYSMDGRPTKRRKRSGRFTGVENEDSEDNHHEQENDNTIPYTVEAGFAKLNAVVFVDPTPPPPPSTSQPLPTVGGALQRNPDGSSVTPRILPSKRKGNKIIIRKWRKGPAAKGGAESAQSDSSFDSSDSANDSSEDDDSKHSSEAEYTPEDGNESDEARRMDVDVDDSDEEDMDEERASGSLKRKRGFKEWAITQLSAVKGYVAPLALNEPANSESGLDSTGPLPSNQRTAHSHQPSAMRGPLGEILPLPSTALARHVQDRGKQDPATRKIVCVSRPEDVREARILLPIVAEEQPIMEAILLTPVVIICGETGSGKTTQVPQFLYEAGFGSPGSDNPGMIGVTQPRRVAAMSMASRVAHELSLPSSKVSYQIRYDATVSPKTAIKFMTDGVLLRELATDFLLSKYSVLIIDEAHERSMNTDILIGVLSRVIKLRENMWKEGTDGVKPLRLVIMSATLRVSDFAENKTLFSEPPPIINVAARQHPVTIHFNRRTVSDYVTEAIRKASKIHARLPPGGILIFLTGQNEITGVCRKLEEKYGPRALEDKKRRRVTTHERTNAHNFFTDPEDSVVAKPSQVDVEAEEIDLGIEEDGLAVDVDGSGHAEEDDEALDTDDEELDRELGIDTEESEVPMHIVPLYSLLPSDKQMKVFQPPPPGTRLVVISTNVAETSLTIPGIRYVIDCGRAKERNYNVTSGIQSFQISWVSKASAAQRAGRAGRTGPGHCYRLYSSAIFENHLDAFSQPEILRMPIEGVVLQMKSMHVDAVVNFPFPTPPDRISLRQAETVLIRLGALLPPSVATASTTGGQITDLGRTMSLFPLSPRFSKMLVSGRQHGCLPYIIAIVSAMSAGDPFIREEALEGDDSSDNDEHGLLSHLKSEKTREKEAHKLRRKAYFQSQQIHSSLGKSSSDVFRVLSVTGAYEFAGGGSKFCAEHFVRPKAMEEIHKLRAQISNIVRTNFSGADPGFMPNLPPPNATQLKVLRQLLTAGFIDQVAVRKDLVNKDSASGNKYTTAKGVPYRALGIEEDVYIHRSSVLCMSSPPDYVVYHEVVRTSQIWIKDVTVINPAWLASLGKPSLCTFSKPFKNRAGDLMVTPKFGPEGWELPAVNAKSIQ
ncbi:P-loop containing nucleoside triphosphate hydrolase protein [Amylostereum chailletii]|nr:P-loop containing nucleoside triphosphate hydrolase protein [Amylostereum chailletii]